ncbi:MULTISPECIES: polyphosphate kinase 2 [unclassified Corynebacterium]|uniref:polyphosphate kinase 2 n=1 Tax=unclassified Corynebacterium TaxID=2624378 RepID=UPI0026470563|nr:polyphosphate kinase 2 [Corynebacterium sp.]MDN5721014.1 polyphosphate kinase 2 [Corynebacterium sp.]MDN5896881.1 polyphosphate kinase 2 [Nocardioides sp.]MDN6258538.1 polyphosphate kinase 2 [Corynebacterium sp.]MDN6510963.1 polyphosphate kinase 2 [Corynebacterium sp.]
MTNDSGDQGAAAEQDFHIVDLASTEGYIVDDSDEDDPVLITPDGHRVDTWRENYPYSERIGREEYETTKRSLQIELLKWQNWTKDTGQKHIILFEGRDAAGKGGTIKRFNEHLNPRGARTVALEKPSPRESTSWYFQRYIQNFPCAGETVFFDRSWYNRSGVERVMGFCTDDQHAEFLREVPMLENMLMGSGISITKLWFSVTQKEQRTRFAIRQVDPVRQWKLSPMDLASLDKWDDYTRAKEEQFRYTDTNESPWITIKSNDKKRARLNAMRYVLSKFNYTGKDYDVVGEPDPRIVKRGRDQIGD